MKKLMRGLFTAMCLAAILFCAGVSVYEIYNSYIAEEPKNITVYQTLATLNNTGKATDGDAKASPGDALATEDDATATEDDAVTTDDEEAATEGNELSAEGDDSSTEVQ